MAADTREDQIVKAPEPARAMASPAPGTAHEPRSAPVAPPNANALPGGSGLNTAGGKTREAGVFDALKSIKITEFTEIHKKPCVRDSLLTGIGGGFGIGGVRAIWGATVWSSCNWAVGSFVFGSFMMYEFCQRRRQLEMQGMKRAVEVIDRKQAEKQKQAEEFRAARRKAKEETS